MNRVLGFLFFVIGINCHNIEKHDVQPKERIFGGFFDTIEEVPYTAQILQHGRLLCGASIISEHWILTAAHCIGDAEGMSIVTGSDMRSLGGQEHQIDKIISHEKYNSQILDNDIALIKLAKPITFNTSQKPVPLKMTTPKTDEILKVSGFGRQGDDAQRALYIKSMKVFVIGNDQCQSKYPKKVKITDNMFCADSPLSDACKGDSGGPAVIGATLAGIVSFGGNCQEYSPGVYTKVLNYHKWISDKTGISI